MEKPIRILILEDSCDDFEFIEHQLKKGDFLYSLKVVETRNDYENSLKEFQPDIVLSDHSLPMFDSRLALQMFHSYRRIYNPAAAFILVTGTVSEEFAVQIMKEGADDYILKDRLKRLPAAVQNALEKNKLKDQRRKEEEEKLYLFDILQRSLHEIFLIDPVTLKFEYVNGEALKSLGYSMKEMSTMTPADTIKNFDLSRFHGIVHLSEESKKGLIVERIAVRKDRSTYPIQIHLQVIGQGEKKKFLANVLDITEAKQLEQEKELTLFIQNSFNHKRSLQESLEVVLENFTESCSWIAAEIYSREFEEPGSKLLASFNPFNTNFSTSGDVIAEKVYELGSSEIFKSKGDLDKEKIDKYVQQVLPDGIVAIPLTLGEELIAVLVGFTKDPKDQEKKYSVISDQVQNKLGANIKRKRSEEELQKIFDFSPDILTVLGKDGYVRKVNPALQKILGYSPEEMLTICYDDLIHPDDVHVLEEWRKQEFNEDEVAYYESRLKTKKGDYKCFSWSITPYMKGELFFAVGRDISEMKEQVDAIREQNKKLAEIAWEQSHIVRAPLTRLLACVEYLEETEGEENEILSSVKRSAVEIDHITKRIVQKSERIKLNGEK